MNIRPTLRLLLPACFVPAMMFTAGCEDSAAKQRAEVQRAIEQASLDFRQAALGPADPASEDFADVERGLSAVASRMGAVREGSRGQQAAAAMIAGEALSELAVRELAGAARIERSLQNRRALVFSELESARRLGAFAAGQAAITTEAEQQSLRRDREAAERDLRDLMQRIDQLDAPIAELTEQNVQDLREAERLRGESEDLLRRAIELGHSRGLEDFKRSVQRRRDADAIDLRIAEREIELNYDLEPEHGLTQIQAQRQQSMLESIAATLRELERFEQAFAEDRRQTEAQVERLRASLGEKMIRVSEIAADLADLYHQAEQRLEQAAGHFSQASRNLSGADAQSATIAEARARERLARLYMDRARSLAEHGALLSAIIEAADVLGPAAGYGEELAAITAERDRLIEQAQQALSEAEAAAGRVSGRSAEAAELFRQQLQAHSATLAGEEFEMPAPVPPAERRPDRPEPTADGEGFASVEEAAAFLGALQPTDRSGQERLLAAMVAETGAGRTLIRLQEAMTGPTLDLLDALEERFGSAGVQAFMEDDMLGGASQSFENSRIAEQGEDTATITYRDAMGQSSTVRLIRRPAGTGRWLIDADHGAREMSELMGGADLSMMEPMFQQVASAMRSVAQRVRGGELNSPEEVMDAIGAAMMQGF